MFNWFNYSYMWVIYASKGLSHAIFYMKLAAFFIIEFCLTLLLIYKVLQKVMKKTALSFGFPIKIIIIKTYHFHRWRQWLALK